MTQDREGQENGIEGLTVGTIAGIGDTTAANGVGEVLKHYTDHEGASPPITTWYLQDLDISCRGGKTCKECAWALKTSSKNRGFYWGICRRVDFCDIADTDPACPAFVHKSE